MRLVGYHHNDWLIQGRVRGKKGRGGGGGGWLSLLDNLEFPDIR